MNKKKTISATEIAHSGLKPKTNFNFQLYLERYIRWLYLITK